MLPSPQSRGGDASRAAALQQASDEQAAVLSIAVAAGHRPTDARGDPRLGPCGAGDERRDRRHRPARCPARGRGARSAVPVAGHESGLPSLVARPPRAAGRPRRPPGHVPFDLDGVAKGWIADRALALLDRYPGALVDADGDIAIRARRTTRGSRRGRPAHRGSHSPAVLRARSDGRGARYGLATSGTQRPPLGRSDGVAITSSTRAPAGRRPRTSSRRPSWPGSARRRGARRRRRSCSAWSPRSTRLDRPDVGARSCWPPTDAFSRSPARPRWLA